MTVAGDTSQELCPRASGSPATGGGLEISYKATPVPTRTSLPKGRVLAICPLLDFQSWRRASSRPSRQLWERDKPPFFTDEDVKPLKSWAKPPSGAHGS